MKDLRGAEERIAHTLRALYSAYGYTQYRMSKFEEYDLYVRNKSFLLSDSVITFTDTSGKLLALKPDVTLSIVKNLTDAASGVKKLYYNESVYRISARTGAYREISQTGLEVLGDVDAYHLSEVLLLAQRSLAAISSEYVLNVSHMGLLSLAMDEAGIPDGERAEVLSLVSQKNRHDLRAWLSARGIGDATALFALLTASGSPDEVLASLSSVSDADAWRAALDELSLVLSPLELTHVQLDFSLIHDLSYYNGTVFGGFVAGVPECVLSGGQYDRLMERMGKHARAVGFAVYPDKLEGLDAPEELDADTVILYTEKDSPAAVADAVRARVARGERTLAVREIPAGHSYRTLCRLDGSEVKVDE